MSSSPSFDASGGTVKDNRYLGQAYAHHGKPLEGAYYKRYIPSRGFFWALEGKKYLDGKESR
jgi:hypothetical protein